MRKFFSNFSNQVIAGFLLGVICALLFGRHLIWLKPLGHIYATLLQAVVYPYLIATLISSLGRLSTQDMRHLLRYTLWAYGLLLFIVYAAQFLTIHSFSTAVHGYRLSQGHPVDVLHAILQMVVPRNIIHALSHDLVPAIILFSILFGVALRKAQKTDTLLRFFDGVAEVSLSYWRILTRFAPIGVFALVASALGNIDFSHLSTLFQFLLLFFFAVLCLSFWVLPMLICRFAGVKYRAFFVQMREGLIISVSTGISALALPYIQQATAKLFEINDQDEESQRLIASTSNIAYPFAQIGNFFVWLFMVTAAVYFMVPIHASAQIVLPFFSYLSAIGSPSSILSAILFLSNWLHMPEKSVNLFIEILPIIRYGQVLVSVIGISFIVMFVMAQHQRRAFYAPWRALCHIVLFFIIIALLSFGVAKLFSNQDMVSYQKILNLRINPKIQKTVKAHISKIPAHLLPASQRREGQSVLSSIRDTHLLKVGFIDFAYPFSYFNDQQQLVGLDIAYAYHLAHTLQVNLEFVPYRLKYAAEDLSAGKIDMAVGGLFVTAKRLEHVSFTHSYQVGRIALVVRAKEAALYGHYDTAKDRSFQIGVFDDPMELKFARRYFPNAHIVLLSKGVKQILSEFTAHKIDAVLWTQYPSQAWALGHVGYVSVIPTGLSEPHLVSFMIAQHDPLWRNYLNYWLLLQHRNGVSQRLQHHWLSLAPYHRQYHWDLLDFLNQKLSL